MLKKFYLFFIILLLSVKAFPQTPFLIEEEFNNGTTPPAGWTFSAGVSSDATTSMCGKSAPALKFANNDQVTTTTWANGDQITFLMRAYSQTTTADQMKVEVFNGSWSTLTTIQPHDRSATVTTLLINTTVTQARFTYTKVNASVSLDDFTVRKAGSCSASGIKLTFINVDACSSGHEGTDEFFTFTTGSTPLNLTDIEFSYPDANANSVTLCGTSANAPCDNYITTNSTQVSSLNTLAGCSIFTSPSGSIPANSKVIVFNGSAQVNLTDFGSLCTSGVHYYAIYTNNSSDANGRFGNYNTNSTDHYRQMFMRDRSTGCTDTNYYFNNNIGLSDGAGNNVDGASVSYSGSSPSYISTNCNYLVLPIMLLSFSAEKRQDAIHLTWVTASEENNNFFTIEKSRDGLNFTSITSLAGAGNSTTNRSYSFDDYYPAKGIWYYRLRQTDYDGTSTISKTIAVNAESKTETAYIYPNPFSDKINIAMSFLQKSGSARFLLTNSLGQFVSSDKLHFDNSFSTFELNYSGLSAGIYFLKAEANESSFYFKLIKN